MKNVPPDEQASFITYQKEHCSKQHIQQNVLSPFITWTECSRLLTQYNVRPNESPHQACSHGTIKVSPGRVYLCQRITTRASSWPLTCITCQPQWAQMFVIKHRLWKYQKDSLLVPKQEKNAPGLHSGVDQSQLTQRCCFKLVWSSPQISAYKKKTYSRLSPA